MALLRKACLTNPLGKSSEYEKNIATEISKLSNLQHDCSFPALCQSLWARWILEQLLLPHASHPAFPKCACETRLTTLELTHLREDDQFHLIDEFSHLPPSPEVVPFFFGYFWVPFVFH